MQYIKIESPGSEKTQCACSTEIKALQDELSSSKHALHSLTQQLSVHLLPFCEESFKSDNSLDFILDYQTSQFMKCIFEHSLKRLSQEDGNKLTLFRNLFVL